MSAPCTAPSYIALRVWRPISKQLVGKLTRPGQPEHAIAARLWSDTCSIQFNLRRQVIQNGLQLNWIRVTFCVYGMKDTENGLNGYHHGYGWEENRLLY